MNRPTMPATITAKTDAPTDDDSRDVVDHCAPLTTHHNQPPCKPTENQTNKTKNIFVALQKHRQHDNDDQQQPPPGGQKPATTRRKGSFPSLDNLPIFQFQRKRGGSAPVVHTINAAASKEHSSRPAFVKSSSIARLFGNTYNTKRSESETTNATTTTTSNKSETNPSSKHGGSAHHHPERFQSCESEQHEFADRSTMVIASPLLDTDALESNAAANPFRSLSRGLGRLFWKKSYSVSISEPDPEFKVAYLGNVLTGWAKGDSCMEKPLATLWRNYTQNYKPDVSMRVKICSSGLKATTRQHGLTEYWSHRITHCSSPKNYPKVFCWIYRHEGRKLKHELRCHAVLCAKESIADSIAKTLQDNLTRALKEFKRDKINKQNARLSLVNSVYENPSMPQRKILLSVGSANYRPPLERSKSAPRLMVIEETGEEPDEDDDEENGGGKPAPRRQCCTMDPLYPAMTLGRRRCKRGHSIRRNGNRHTRKLPNKVAEKVRFHETIVTIPSKPLDVEEDEEEETQSNGGRARIGSDSGDDLDKLLLRKDYDTASPLADELMSYFDMKFKTKTISMIDLQPTEDEQPLYTVRTSLSLDNLDSYSDDGEDAADDLLFDQDHILSTLIRNSNRSSSMTQRHQLDDNDDDADDNRLDMDAHREPSNANALVSTCDSDEGSISSGFDTASTVTGNADLQTKSDAEHNQNSLECSSVRTTPLATVKAAKPYRTARSSSDLHQSSDSDESDFSDESGYVEYQQDSITAALPITTATINNNNHRSLVGAKSQSIN